jgi:REP element-mobilizing transposase RayT
MRSPQIQVRQGAYLPHWTREGATYFITYRTADSLPATAIEKLQVELRILDRKLEWGELTPEEEARKSALKSDAYLRMLDNCYGACVLRRDDCAEVACNALSHFAEVQYRLWAWCIMPNHVHAVVQPFAGFELSRILHGWKSVSSRRIGKLIGQKGTFWQSEYYDRLVRDDAEFAYYVQYTLENPAAAGLRNWKWAGKWQG